jgi:hypothetical protein
MTWRQRMIYREGGAGIDVLGRRPIGWHTLEYGSLESLIPHEWPWNVHVPETGCGWSAQLVYSPSPPLCKLRSHGAKMLPGIHVHGGRGGGWRALTAAYASVKRFNHQSSRHPSTEPASLLRISYRITCRVQPGSCCACCVHWGISTVHRTYGTVVPSALQPGRQWVSNTLSIPPKPPASGGRETIASDRRESCGPCDGARRMAGWERRWGGSIIFRRSRPDTCTASTFASVGCFNRRFGPSTAGKPPVSRPDCVLCPCAGQVWRMRALGGEEDAVAAGVRSDGPSGQPVRPTAGGRSFCC